MKRLILIATVACLCLSQAAAQGSRPERPARPDSLQGREHRFAEVPNPEKAAKAETDRLQKELQLTDKQYKKVYKLILKEQKERLANRPSIPVGGRGNMPPRREGGRPQTQQGGGEGFPPMGEGNGFPMQMWQGEDDMPFRDNQHDHAKEMRKEAEKQEKKMKKILTDEQFAKWKKMQARRPEHHPDGKRPVRKQQEEQPESTESRLTDQ